MHWYLFGCACDPAFALAQKKFEGRPPGHFGLPPEVRLRWLSLTRGARPRARGYGGAAVYQTEQGRVLYRTILEACLDGVSCAGEGTAWYGGSGGTSSWFVEASTRVEDQRLGEPKTVTSGRPTVFAGRNSRQGEPSTPDDNGAYNGWMEDSGSRGHTLPGTTRP